MPLAAKVQCGPGPPTANRAPAPPAGSGPVLERDDTHGSYMLAAESEGSSVPSAVPMDRGGSEGATQLRAVDDEAAFELPCQLPCSPIMSSRAPSSPPEGGTSRSMSVAAASDAAPAVAGGESGSSRSTARRVHFPGAERPMPRVTSGGDWSEHSDASSPSIQSVPSVGEEDLTRAGSPVSEVRSFGSFKSAVILSRKGGPTVLRCSTGAACWLGASNSPTSARRSPNARMSPTSKQCRSPGLSSARTTDTSPHRSPVSAGKSLASTGDTRSTWPSMLGSPRLRGEHSVRFGLRGLWEDFRIIGDLGKGSFGLVQRAVRKADLEEVAIKSVTHESMQDCGKGSMATELDIAARLRHPNIAMLYSVYRDEEYVHLVLELCRGGDLFDLISKGHFFSEKKIAVYLWQMVSGIAYCHHNLICHRDIKPENYLLDTSRGDASLKLIDFGLSCVFAKGQMMTSKVGSPYYVAPEVLSPGRYNEKRDIWSIGIIGFLLCTMRLPYSGKTEESIVKAITESQLEWVWLDGRLEGANPIKLLIFQMLTEAPWKRPSAKELTEDEWFQQQGLKPLRRSWLCPCFLW